MNIAGKPRTPSINIGGLHLTASVFDEAGYMWVDPVGMKTAPPKRWRRAQPTDLRKI